MEWSGVRDLQTVQKMLQMILKDDRPIVLAMIVHVQGSAYRKEGSWMLLPEDGTQIGIISGGCLENDLQERAKKLFGIGQAEIVEYDLSAEDDSGWGRGAGCNGVVSVMIRDIDEQFRKCCRQIAVHLLKKEPVVFLQSMQDFSHSRSISMEDNENPFKQENIQPFQEKAGMKMLDGNSFYCQIIWPQPTLYIIGTGADARPLAQLASQAGYAIHLLDWRQSLCNARHFPMADSFQIGDIGFLIAEIQFSPLDSVVIMTHDYQLDVRILQRFKNIQVLYLGILGSKRRTERLLGGVIPKWIHSPVGLSIGADGPEEIAVSIVAELIALRRGKLT
jgi:xanthine/CO dehydrogenase XdhC/CoxF family maturation factor